MTRAAFLIAACAALAACDDNADVAAGALNLDRPVDVSFACYGSLRITNGAPADITQPIEQSAQPLASCDTRSTEIVSGGATPVPTGQEDLAAMGGQPVSGVDYYAFILESAPGTVALAQWDSTRPPNAFTGTDITVLDTDPLVPGKNGISVGVLPIAIATDKVGCFELTANAGSCDMTSLEVNSAIAAAVNGENGQIRVDALPVVDGMGNPMKAKPAAMVGEPAGGPIGVECPMQPTGLVFVAYPNCHSVAQIDTATGTIVDHIDFAADGTVTVNLDGNLSCPNECGGEATTAGTRPVALDLFQDTRVASTYLAIGADNSNLVTIVALDANNKPVVSPAPLSPFQIALEQNPTKNLGITQVALTRQMGMGGDNPLNYTDASAPGGQSQFVYAVTTDGSVRVASILPGAQFECDTQTDPRYLHDNQNIQQMSCLQVGAATTPPRRPGARGPGIRLVGDNFALSVMVFSGLPEPNDDRAFGPLTLIGDFGVITGSDGGSYVFNINDQFQADFVAQGSDPTWTGPNFHSALAAPIPMDIAHQLRDGTPDRDALAEDASGNPVCTDVGPDPDAASGADAGTRLGVPAGGSSVPSILVPTTYLGANKVNELPSIRQVLCHGSDVGAAGAPVSELSFSAPVAMPNPVTGGPPINVREQEFPDLRGTRSDETFTLTWQGPLSGDTTTTANNGPAIRTGGLAVDENGLHLQDATGPFCNAGVQPYDIVQLRGCDPTLGDAECPENYTCFVHPDSTVADLGACIATSEAARLADACREYLISLRRYTVGKATTGELLLLPRKHVLRTTPVDGCTGDQQCQSLANYAAQNASTENPSDDRTPPDTHTWSCQADPSRGDTLKRCIETCTQDSDCIAGYVCQTGFCMEGVLPPQSCINSTQRYDLRANEAFTVVGTKSGYVHPIIADTSGNCVVDPTASPWQVGRIPLTAPACDPTADPFTGKRMDGTFDANPCELTAAQSELDPAYQAGTCSLTSASTVLNTRQTDAIRYRGPGMTLTLVDPTYPGDSQCILDRGGTLGKIPLVDDLDQISFRLSSGLSTLVLSITPSFPVKALRGPGQSIWIVDEGDFLSTSIDEASTNGKVFRVESQTLGTVNVLQ
ncbi:MAG TPA: hypothetical protein VMJ10_12410 [Kofleriaceae bacterium]|nr:hypothetical protein [Kofleriaceae bacterium]